MCVKEGAGQPRDTENAHHTDQTGAENGTGGKLIARNFADHDDHQSGSEHHHLNQRGDGQLADLASNFPRRTKCFRRTDRDRSQNTDSENQHTDLGALAGFSVDAVRVSDMQFRVLAALDAMDEFRILFQFAAAPVHRQAGGKQGDKVGRHGHGQNIKQGVAESRHDAHHGCHGGAHGAGHHADAGANHRG